MTVTVNASIARVLASFRNVFSKSLMGGRVRTVTALTAAQLLASLIGFAEAVFAARSLGPRGYGDLALIIALPTLFLSFASVKTVSVTTSYLARYRAQADAVRMRAVCGLSYYFDGSLALVAVIVTAVAVFPVTDRVYGRPELAPLMMLYASVLPISALNSTSGAVLNAFEHYRWMVVLQVGEKAASFAFLLVALSLGLGVTGAVVAAVLAQAVSSLLALACAHRIAGRFCQGQKRGGPGLPALDSIERAQLLGEVRRLFGWNYVLVGMSGAAVQLPLLIVGKYFGPGGAGIFRLGTTVATAAGYLELALARIAQPILVRRLLDDGHELPRTLRRWTIVAGVPAASVVAMLVPVLPLGIVHLMGDQYKSAIPVISILVAGSAVGALFFWMHSYYFARSEISLFTKRHAVYTATSVVAVYLTALAGDLVAVAVVVSLWKALFIAAMALSAFRTQSMEGVGR